MTYRRKDRSNLRLWESEWGHPWQKGRGRKGDTEGRAPGVLAGWAQFPDLGAGYTCVPGVRSDQGVSLPSVYFSCLYVTLELKCLLKKKMPNTSDFPLNQNLFSLNHLKAVPGRCLNSPSHTSLPHSLALWGPLGDGRLPPPFPQLAVPQAGASALEPDCEVAGSPGSLLPPPRTFQQDSSSSLLSSPPRSSTLHCPQPPTLARGG